MATASVLVSESPEEPVAPVEIIVVTPSAIVADPGEVLELSAVAYATDGRKISDVEIVWSVADPRVGAIDRAGRFQAGSRPGVYDGGISAMGIQNTPEGMKHAAGSATVTVVGEAEAQKLAMLEIVSDSPTVIRKQIFRMSAVALDKDGFVIPGVRFVWQSNSAEMGEINELGYLAVKGDVGTYPDAVTVTAVWEGERLSATTDVRVISTPQTRESMQVHALPQRFFLDPGDRLQLKAVALNGLGELVVGTQIRWEMSDPTAGTIDGKGNFIAGTIPGVYTEAVRVEAIFPGETGFVRASDFASVVVRKKEGARKLTALVVMPETLVIGPGGIATPMVRAVDNAGEPAENVVLSWKLLNQTAGAVDETGSFRAGQTPGVYSDALRVTAVQPTDTDSIVKARTVNVVVTGSLARAMVEPEVATVVAGRTIHFSATGFDENEVLLPGLVVIWRVSDDQIGVIDAFGNFTAGKNPGFYEDAVRAEIVQQLSGPH